MIFCIITTFMYYMPLPLSVFDYYALFAVGRFVFALSKTFSSYVSGGGHIFAFSGVRHHTSFPLILSCSLSWVKTKNFNFRNFWRPSWILAENKKV